MIKPGEFVVGIDCEHEKDMGLASEILRTLVDTYPGQHWFVIIRSAVIQIKISNWSGSWGMILHYNDISHDASYRARKVKHAAGEFLERANVIRGRGNGDKVRHIEGVPDKAIIRI